MKFPKNIYIHILGAYINMLQTNKKSIETIYFQDFIIGSPSQKAEIGEGLDDGKKSMSYEVYKKLHKLLF